MPRIRYLKPEFFSDEGLAELKFETRIAYAGLWCFADKEGRLEDRPKYLKVMIFPYDNIDMGKQLEILSCVKNGSQCSFIQRYQVDDLKLIQIVKWHKHQSPHHTEKESIFPPAPPYKDKDKDKEKAAQSELEVKERIFNVPLTVKHKKNNDFEVFYKNYPVRIGKERARKVWDKINNLPPLNVLICTINTQKKWREEANGEFRPEWKHPATWLNAKGWEDEIPISQPTIKPSEGRVIKKSYDCLNCHKNFLDYEEYLKHDCKPLELVEARE